MGSINNLLSGSISEEDKSELLLNSGLCKYNNDYLLLMKIKEDDEKMFYLKNGLCNTKITSLNNDKNFQVYQIVQSQESTAIYTSENELYSNKDIVEERLYSFGNYSYENDLRTYIKNFISNNKEVYELPRLYVLLNYCIPIEKDKFQFIINVKKVIENSSYGYGEMDFILKNDSKSDIIIENEDMPYKEKIYMTFPLGDKKVNNQKIILKKNSIIFFEFKSAFPQFNWREKFSHLFKKVEKFIKIYQNRGLSYNNEYIQIYLLYDNLPDLYNIKFMKSYINQQFSKLFEKFEFGLYYFSKGITIINNQILEKKLETMEKKMEIKMEKEMEIKMEMEKKKEKKLDDIYNILKLIKDENIQKELQKVFEK